MSVYFHSRTRRREREIEKEKGCRNGGGQAGTSPLAKQGCRKNTREKDIDLIEGMKGEEKNGKKRREEDTNRHLGIEDESVRQEGRK